MTVVEQNEWIPFEQFPLQKDNITDTYLGTIQAKLPNSALGHHGLLIRLMSKGESYDSFDRKGALLKYQSQSEVIKVMLYVVSHLKNPVKF